MADSSQIGLAIVNKLRADAALSALMPGGVSLERGPTGAQQLVVVSLLVGHDVRMFNGRAFEEPLYLVKAVELSTVTPHNVDAAAARIDVLLDLGTLTIPGYAFKAMYREEHVRLSEDDDRDPSISWTHAGGRYLVSASPLT
jgi:hypothetical protein